MNYARLYASRAQRLVEVGSVNLESFVRELIDDGVPLERINQLLIEDLETNGRIFGQFFRDLGAAGETAISVAEAQGSTVAEAIALDDRIAAFSREARQGGRTVDAALADGDPDALEAVENAADEQRLRWIATLRRTCPICLSLHGKDLTRREWREFGYRPRMVHPHCECDWEPTEIAASYSSLTAPLRREIEAGQSRGGRRTKRAVTQQDVDGAIAAREKALQTPEGRRILRQLGQSGEET